MSTVRPRSACRDSTSSRMSSRSDSSRALKGSSMSTAPGAATSARARATRWRCPPEISCVRRSPRPASCTFSSIRAACSRRDVRPTPRTLRGKATLSSTLMLGKSRASWNTIATPRLLAGRSSTARPSKSTRPESCTARPLTTRRSVVLPAPLSPRMETNAPWGTQAHTSRRSGVPLAARQMWSRSMRMGGSS